MTSPVAGLTTSRTSVEGESVHWPLMKLVRRRAEGASVVMECLGHRDKFSILKRFYKSRNLYSVCALLSFVDFSKLGSLLLTKFFRWKNLDDVSPVLAPQIRIDSHDRV